MYRRKNVYYIFLSYDYNFIFKIIHMSKGQKSQFFLITKYHRKLKI